jgi:hypothetical protein
MQGILPLAIYLLSAVVAYAIARKVGVRRWLAIVVAWLGPVGLLGTLAALLRAWRSGLLEGGRAQRS